MKKILIFGNSGSGKSTLAKKLSTTEGLSHLDLDTLAWQEGDLPKRRPLSESERDILAFIETNKSWVIEGCYSDLLVMISSFANEMVFMNLPIELCQQNAKERPWEPHKYATKEAQDANLAMLLTWIGDYAKRNDTFSLTAHKALFDSFDGIKTQIQSNQD